VPSANEKLPNPLSYGAKQGLVTQLTPKEVDAIQSYRELLDHLKTSILEEESLLEKL